MCLGMCDHKSGQNFDLQMIFNPRSLRRNMKLMALTWLRFFCVVALAAAAAAAAEVGSRNPSISILFLLELLFNGGFAETGRMMKEGRKVKIANRKPLLHPWFTLKHVSVSTSGFFLFSGILHQKRVKPLCNTNEILASHSPYLALRPSAGNWTAYDFLWLGCHSSTFSPLSPLFCKKPPFFTIEINGDNHAPSMDMNVSRSVIH